MLVISVRSVPVVVDKNCRVRHLVYYPSGSTQSRNSSLFSQTHTKCAQIRAVAYVDQVIDWRYTVWLLCKYGISGAVKLARNSLKAYVRRPEVLLVVAV
jgi:hypothetical protein